MSRLRNIHIKVRELFDTSYYSTEEERNFAKNMDNSFYLKAIASALVAMTSGVFDILFGNHIMQKVGRLYTDQED